MPWRRGRFPRPCGSGNSKSRTARPCMTPLQPDASQPANRPTATPTTRCAGTAVASPHHSHHRRRVACQRGVVVGEERRRTRRQIRFLWRLLRFRLCGWRWRRISTFSRGNNGTLSRLSVCSIMILPSPLVLSDGEATIVGLVRRGKACSGQWIEPLLPLHPKIKVVVYPIMLLPYHEEKNEA